MFDWLFPPRCPVEPREKAWVEYRMAWLAGELGLKRVQNARVILPCPEFFPDEYDGSTGHARKIFTRVCNYMGLSPKNIPLGFYTEDDFLPVEGFQQHKGTAGLHEGTNQGSKVWIESKNLTDPLSLVATAAHELGHVILLGQGRISPDEEDNEPLTDLITIFLGLGVFTANTRVRSQSSSEGMMDRWSISRMGYLSQPVIGYALAVFAYIRGEDSPAWARELCVDVRSVMKKGLRYLVKTGDCLYDRASGTFRSRMDDTVSPALEAFRPAEEPTSSSSLLDDELPPGYERMGS